MPLSCWAALLRLQTFLALGIRRAGGRLQETSLGVAGSGLDATIGLPAVTIEVK
jgi:hypothetical protein